MYYLFVEIEQNKFVNELKKEKSFAFIIPTNIFILIIDNKFFEII